MRKFALLIFLLGIQQCASTQYMDVKKDTGSRHWGAKEINETVDKMVSSLYAQLKGMNSDVLIAVNKVRNRTSEHIDTSMVMNEITTKLIKRGIPFIDKAHRSESIKEIEFGQTGMVDTESAISVGKLKSPNYELTGDITDNVVYDGDRKKQYIIVTLKLIEVATTAVLWQENQEFLKVSQENQYGW